MCVFSLTLICWNPNFNVMALGGEAFGRWGGPGGVGLMDVVGPFLYCVSLWKFQENVSNLPRDPVLLQYTSSVSALLSPQMEPSSHSQTVFAKGCWIGACTSNSFPSVSVFVEIYLLQSLDKYLSLIEKQYLQVLCAYKNLSLLDIIFLFSSRSTQP